MGPDVSFDAEKSVASVHINDVADLCERAPLKEDSRSAWGLCKVRARAGELEPN